MNLSEQHVTLKQKTHVNLDTMFIDIKYEVNKYRGNVRQGNSINQIYALSILANNYMSHILKLGSEKMFPCLKTILIETLALKHWCLMKSPGMGVTQDRINTVNRICTCWYYTECVS